MILLTIFFSALFILFILIVWFFLFPIRYVKNAEISKELFEPPDIFIYSYEIHIHSQFSYDSLGKPEDILRARDKEGIDFIIITDHNNDRIKNFLDKRAIAGIEEKLHNEKYEVVGDILKAGNIRVIAHHFGGKYRWKLEKRNDYLIELVDLRDAILENKFKLLVYLFTAIILYPIFGKKRLRENFKKLIDIEKYAREYLKEGWRAKPIGGLDHHVKIYIEEVRKKKLIPSYEDAFNLMRNFALMKEKVKDINEFLGKLNKATNVISFSKRPAVIWQEKETIKVYSPYENTYIKVIYEGMNSKETIGPNGEFKSAGNCLILGYTYSLRIGKLLFGLKPLFVSEKPKGDNFLNPLIKT